MSSVSSSISSSSSPSYRYRFISYYLKNKKSFKEHNLSKIFGLSEECYKFICNILLDNNYDVIQNNTLSNSEFCKSMTTTYSCFFDNQDYDNARNILDYVAIATEGDIISLLLLEFRYYCLDNVETFRNDIVDFPRLYDDNFTPSNTIEKIMHQLFTMMKNKKKLQIIQRNQNNY